ncbi:MAG: hypothetical protein DWQ05_16655 [Calditrichaeota bacterium]|nr:MAG: hypothetical protein DWQ05_16655 [Calditrichota bacterium]
MKRTMFLSKITLIIAVLFLLNISLGAMTPGELKKEFSDINRIKINTISGDCIIQKGNSKVVKLSLDHTYSSDSGFIPIIEKRGSMLMLKEKFEGRHSRGSAVWTLSVPDGLDIKFNTASGSLEISQIKVDVDANTASGDLDLNDIQGELDMNTASGDIDCQNIKGNRITLNTASGRIKLVDIEADFKAGAASGTISASNVAGKIRMSVASGDINVDNCKGELKLSAASGDIEVTGLQPTDDCEFSTASGNVDVRLGSSPEYDLSLSSASGNSRLDFNGNKINAMIEMTARAKRNRISAPFKFDTEDVHSRWNNHDMVTKIAKIGSGGPYIRIETASGKAVVRK